MTTPTTFRDVALPTADEEIWRYSRIGELDLAKYVPGRVDTTVEAPGAAASIVNAKGTFADCGKAMPIAVDAFAEISAIQSTGDSPDVTVVRVPRGAAIAEPIVVTRTVTTPGILATPRLVIDAGENSEVTVIERFTGADGIDSLVVPVVEMIAAQAARITYLAINELGDRTWKISHQQSLGERDSTTRIYTVALGGDYARVRTEARLVGTGATTQQVALYFADNNQMHDFRTLQTHVAPRTHSDMLFKGAVAGTSKSVYTGLIRIEKDAHGSQAYQTNRNLTLSEGAWAESVPNLEIETNDVKCSHASTVGPIDDEQRFYLESRGIRPEIAERLVVLGFFNEVIERLPNLPVVAGLRDKVAAKLGAAL
ncbi:MAG: Fe-S cluster assembly protein SufD [Ilumatobacteraceae bacterium]|nr:Fe-S cluster assembly protein SufD [Ilumatobacteraceae bacterium]